MVPYNSNRALDRCLVAVVSFYINYISTKHHQHIFGNCYTRSNKYSHYLNIFNVIFGSIIMYLLDYKLKFCLYLCLHAVHYLFLESNCRIKDYTFTFNLIDHNIISHLIDPFSGTDDVTSKFLLFVNWFANMFLILW